MHRKTMPRKKNRHRTDCDASIARLEGHADGLLARNSTVSYENQLKYRFDITVLLLAVSDPRTAIFRAKILHQQKEYHFAMTA